MLFRRNSVFKGLVKHTDNFAFKWEDSKGKPIGKGKAITVTGREGP
jgi:hypothetical protein